MSDSSNQAVALGSASGRGLSVALYVRGTASKNRVTSSEGWFVLPILQSRPQSFLSGGADQAAQHGDITRVPAACGAWVLNEPAPRQAPNALASCLHSVSTAARSNLAEERMRLRIGREDRAALESPDEQHPIGVPHETRGVAKLRSTLISLSA